MLNRKNEEDISVLSENSDVTDYAKKYQSEDIYSIFADTLEPKEEILWSMKKSKKLSNTEKENLRKSLFMGIISLAASVFIFMASYLPAKSMDIEIIFISLIFMIIGLWILKTGIPKTNIWYAITNKKVIIFQKGKNEKFSSYNFANIVDIHLNKDKNRKYNLSFSITKTSAPNQVVITIGNNITTIYGISIEEYEYVYNLLKDNAEKSSNPIKGLI